MSQPTIYVSEVKSLLENGVTRKDNDPGYKPELGSIQSKYGLTPSQVTTLFKHPKLVGLKVKKIVEPTYTLVDDTETGYGTPSVAAAERIAETMETEAPEVTAEQPGIPVEEMAQTPSPSTGMEHEF